MYRVVIQLIELGELVNTSELFLKILRYILNIILSFKNDMCKFYEFSTHFDIF